MINKEDLKNELVADVIEQIVSDVRSKDIEAIEELLFLMYDIENMKFLVGYLEEEKTFKYKDLL